VFLCLCGGNLGANARLRHLATPRKSMNQHSVYGLQANAPPGRFFGQAAMLYDFLMAVNSL